MARKRKNIPYSEDELFFLHGHRDLPRRELYAEFVRRFGRDDVTFENIKGLCVRKGWYTGRTGCFDKGHVPANKGRKGNAHVTDEMRATQFKKNHVPANLKPIGHERVDRQGFVLIKIDVTNPHTGFRGHYVMKHKHLWIEKNGPIPDGHFLKCLDCNNLNTDPSNWKLLPLSMQTRLNGIHGRGYDKAPPELRPVIMTICELEDLAYRLKKRKKK